MASWVFSSIQSMSSKVLEAIRGTAPCQQGASSPVADPNQRVVADLQKLNRMLARIMAVQQDAEEREIHDRSVRLWLEELRGVAYLAEDVLDEYHYEVLRSIVESGDAGIQMYHEEDRGKRIKRKFDDIYTSSSLSYSSSSITKISIPDGMGEKIKSITERFEEISNDHRALHLKEDDGIRLITSHQTRPPTTSHVDERAIFGREEEKEKIISLLNTSTGPNFMVLPIVGAGGAGKTTLAQLVYNDVRIHKLFDKRGWLSVSENFDLVRLTKAIIESMSDSPCVFSELSKLQDVLKEMTSSISLFLVLDDVWNEKINIWECFQNGFIGAKTVRILTTTRNTSVSEVMQTTAPFHLDFLPEESCWLLFKHFALDSREAKNDANLLKIGHGIVEKCKGSPLAIKALGGILRYEMDADKWKEVLESNISEIDETGEIMPALWLSYWKLRFHLRPCFLYLSMFPKGTPLQKDTVVRLWLAQGYIYGNTRNSKTLEEIGSEYFDELQGRSLIDHYRGNLKVYVLHDLIHDLASSISQGAYRPGLENYQQFTCKMHHLYLTEPDELSNIFSQCHHRAVRTIANFSGKSHLLEYGIFSKFPCVRALHLMYNVSLDILGTLKHLRYIYVAHDDTLRLPESLCLLYYLQTLDLICPNLQELPENMKNLVNLRHFHLDSKQIKQLPESIFQLQKLHTLSFRYCYKLKELPRGIEQLTELHILDLPEVLINMPYGIGKLKTLKPLTGYFNVMDHGMMGGLGELKDMNKLSGLLFISGLKNIDDMDCSRKANLALKPNLNKLFLNFEEVPDIWGTFKQDALHLFVRSSNATRNENVGKKQEGVLESLRPCGTVTELKILNYRGTIFPSWLINSCLPKLTVVTIDCWSEPNYLPPFGQLAYLRFLKISSGTGVTNAGNEPRTYLLLPNGSSKQAAEISFPSLEVLSLTNMLYLEWQAHESDFPCLKELTVENCPKLWEIATIPREVRKLVMKGCGCHEIHFSSESKIQDVLISNCEELISVHSIGSDLTILEKISVLDCPIICKFPTILERLKMLTIHNCGFREITLASISDKLTISNCRELMSINWSNGSLISTAEITFENCPEMKLLTIPSEFKKMQIHKCGFHEIRFSSISRKLTISNCLELISVNWRDEPLNSIEEVTFECCPKLILSTIPTQIKKLRISCCGFQEIVFPFQSRIQMVDVSHCPALTLIRWEKRDTPSYTEFLLNDYPELKEGVENLQISHCSILQFSMKTVLHLITKRVEIYDCPRMDVGKRYVYQRNPEVYWLYAGNEAIYPLFGSIDFKIPLLEDSYTLFFTKKESLEVESLTCPPCFDPSCHSLMLNLSSLAILAIWRCRKVVSVSGIDNLSKLIRLSISNCPELCDWKDRRLPVALKFLELESCDKLQSVPLLSVENQSSPLKTLAIFNCPMLSDLEGFNGLTNVRRVRLEYCRNISIIPAAESLNFRAYISIKHCPLLRDWCQRHRITYCELEGCGEETRSDI